MTSIALDDRVLVDDRFDQSIRWQPGERLDHLFESVVDRLAAEGDPGRLAVDSDEGAWTFAEVDARASQLARHLASRGVGPGSRVGLLFDQAIDAYTGMLAVLKLNAAYVPLDAGFPVDRLAYICEDAGVSTVVAHSRLQASLAQVAATLVYVDEDAATIAARPAERLSAAERGDPVEELAYVIYTSGSTGRPKGVAINHASICNFVRVAAEVYGVTGRDRVYQGMTIAFDFSVEEIWVPWLVGATLVPKPRGGALVGQELGDFLVARRITGLCCVPTLLATLEEDVPDLRFLLVSGEACPQDLIARWWRPDRRFLNVYGPTETTVTATWTTLAPERKVTIGVPLPTYSGIILQPGADEAVPRGEPGELCIAGICLSPGYLNRPDLTAAAFIVDTHDLPQNPGGRLYRTGDLARIDEHGEIEYLGRIDLQVKIRGYRIELTEIESVVMEFPGVATAVVEPYRQAPGVVELVAYFSRRADARPIDPLEVRQFLRDRVPGYMVPAYFEELDTFPLLPSDKVDRKRLPPPDLGRRLSGSDEYVEPQGPAEAAYAQVLGETLRLERVSASAHFFDDLGANSLLMARFCAQVRARDDLVSPSMKEIYLHPTVRLLSAALMPDGQGATATSGAEVLSTGTEPAQQPRPRTWAYVATGVAQMLVFAAWCYLAATILRVQLTWLGEARGPVDTYVRLLGLSFGLFGLTCVLPVVAKWLLVGRCRPRTFRVWGLEYLRFWTVRMLVQMSPMRAFAGTPIFPWYLRTLGAKVGPRVTILSGSVPPCPDLLTIGSDTVIRKGASFTCYRAEAGVITTAPVTIGERAFIGEGAVLDIETRVGSDAQLGHSSSLDRGQSVPDGQRWHGAPAEPTEANYCQVPAVRLGRFRGVLYGLTKLLVPLLITMPAALGIVVAAASFFPHEAEYLLGHPSLPWSDWSTYVVGIVITLDLYVTGLGVALVVVLTLPRLLTRFLVPDRVYPLFGFRYWCLRTIRRMTNGGFIPLFGDSNYITAYLSLLGYKLKPIQQSGSNFGMSVGHDVPGLVRIGTGTMVSDGLTLLNAEYSSTSFRVRNTNVPGNTFTGNGIAYPADAKLGDDCLLATKVLIPITGEVRSGIGLLGSPAFEIPRIVQRDREAQSPTGDDLDRALARKLRYNTNTIILALLNRWALACVFSLLLLFVVDVLPGSGTWALALFLFCMPAITAAIFITVERAVLGFRRMRALHCSVYDPRFWQHERFWKLSNDAFKGLFVGTPFISIIWRLLGVRVGRRLFDDGCSIIEKSLVTIGDDVTLNVGSNVQGHSLEEGSFKSDAIVLEDGCTLGTGSFVHYGTRVGPGAVIEADAFLMKGEEVPARQRWHGNPALPMRATVTRPAVAPASVGSSIRSGEGTLVVAPPAATAADLLDLVRVPAPLSMAGVSLHLISLGGCAEHEQLLTAVLSPQQRAEAARLRSPRSRLQFVSSRALGVLLLEQELGAASDDEGWWISSAAGSGPRVHGQNGASPSISFSYTDEVLAIALSRDTSVGVDLTAEVTDRDITAEWALARNERQVLAGVGTFERNWEYLRIWSLKEAAAKCLGLGASMRFEALDTTQGVRGVEPGPFGDLRYRSEVLQYNGRRYWLALATRPVGPQDWSRPTPALAVAERS